MGTRITSNEGALYDSVSGAAFGPVFDSRDDAEEFLGWLAEGEQADIRVPYNNDMLRVLSDPRVYRFDELVELKRIWETRTTSNV